MDIYLLCLSHPHGELENSKHFISLPAVCSDLVMVEGISHSTP